MSEPGSMMAMRDIADQAAVAIRALRDLTSGGSAFAGLDDTREVINAAHLTVVDGPAFGDGGAGSFRLNFATPQPILTEMVERVAAALNSAQATGLSGPA